MSSSTSSTSSFDLQSLTDDLDTFWLMFGAILVFFMQCGFAMLEVGSVSEKNTKNILMKNIGDAAIGAICLLYTSPSPRDGLLSRMPSSA